MTRTENSTKNMYTGLIYQLLILIFRFVTRTVFIKCLGSEFLGINGLFSNILTLLSLADLGIGGALVYSLYRPIAINDEKRQVVILSYLKKVYRNIGLAILAIGIILLPFLPFIIKDDVTIVNIYLVFLLYVFQTASSYLFFASNTEFLGANQKRYVYNVVGSGITIFSNVAQIIVLVLFKNFYLYLLVIIAFGILQSFLVAKRARKMYPFIKNKAESELTKEEKKNIYKDCGSLMLYRINYVVLTATDNVIISKYLGLVLVGLYSNYVLITNSIVNLLAIFFDSITASIGNLHALKEEGKEYFVFRLTNFITATLFGIAAVGVYVLANDFINIWLGEEYLLSMLFVFIVSINLYIEGIRKFLSTYRSSYGLFRQAKLMPILGVIVNIVTSIILVQKIGIFGVLLGTLISNLVSFMWYDPYLIYKQVFKENVWKYYIKNICYVLFFIVMGFMCKEICDWIAISGIVGFLIHGIICLLIPSLFIFGLYYQSDYFNYLKEPIKNLAQKIKLKNKKVLSN